MEGVGARLRRIRLSGGESMESVGRRIGVSKGYLSRIENGQVSPSIAVLAKLSNAYGVPMAAFFDSAGGETRISVVRSDERLAVNRDGTELGYVYESIVFKKPDRMTECFVVTMPPVESPRQMYSHPGEELFFVISGEVRFIYGGTEYILKAGDTAYFDASIEHRGEAYNDRPAQALAVIVPPTPGRRGSAGLRSATARDPDAPASEEDDGDRPAEAGVAGRRSELD